MFKSRLVKLSEKHLSLVYQWRNRAEVLENMYTNHKITLDEHHDWFKVGRRILVETTIIDIESDGILVNGEATLLLPITNSSL